MNIVVLMLFILCVSTNLVYADDGVSRMQDFYKTLKDAEGSFTQKNYIKEMNKTRTYGGRFYIKENKMYLDYKGSKNHKVYISGKEIIIYQEAEKTAYKMPFDESKYGQTPITLLKGFTELKREFNIRSISEKRLSLKPIKNMGNVNTIELTMTDEDKTFPINSISIIDKIGNRTEIIFKEIKVNKGVSDKVFVFNPPPDVTVVEN